MDGTGLAGAGSMTGPEFGPCGSNEDLAASVLNGRGAGNRRGMRCGRGIGFGSGFGSGNRGFRRSAEVMTDETRKTYFQQQRAILKARLDTIDKRLETL